MIDLLRLVTLIFVTVPLNLDGEIYHRFIFASLVVKTYFSTQKNTIFHQINSKNLFLLNFYHNSNLTEKM